MGLSRMLHGTFLWSLTALLAISAAATETEPSLERKADGLVKPFADAGVFQGVVLMAVDGEIVYEKAFGKASNAFDVDNTPQTRFHIASVSKPFTAAAIQLLAERGKVDLHAPLNKLLPDFPNGDRLTIDHLLTHTSGIPNINSFEEYDDWSKSNHRPKDLVEKFKDRPLEFAPGTQYDYSNSNYNLLALVVELVSGESFGEFLEKNIFEPLGMRDTAHHQNPDAIVPALATGYSPVGARGFARAPYLDWSIKTGNGSLYSTATDLLKFDRGLRGGRLLKREGLEAGYGWSPGERFNQRRVHASGRSPGFTAWFERFVDQDRCLIVLSNVYINPPPALTEGLAALLLDLEPAETGFDLNYQISAEKLERFTGDYAFGEDWFVGAVTSRIENRGDHLRIVYLEGKNVGYDFPLVPLGETVFFDRKHGGTVRFERESAQAPWTLVYHFGRDWRALRVKDNEE
jgi:CubicO group peptidase (beta-lactamase class C family)